MAGKFFDNRLAPPEPFNQGLTGGEPEMSGDLSRFTVTIPPEASNTATFSAASLGGAAGASAPVSEGESLTWRIIVDSLDLSGRPGLAMYWSLYYYNASGGYVSSVSGGGNFNSTGVKSSIFNAPNGAAWVRPALRVTGTTGTGIAPVWVTFSSPYFGPAVPPKAGVFEVGASTDARLGIVSDVYSRSREKIALELARVDSQLIAGERVELDAAAMTASPVVWHWRQITGPTVELEPREASMDFIAPDVDEDTPLRIAVYAASEDGRNRSDWHYFDLTIKPPIARFRATEGAFSPVSPKYVGYDRGKREVWNDVIPPSGFSPSPRHEVEILDLGIVPDDVQFTTGGPPERAAAGGIYVDLETGDIYRNFGAGYNETDDTTAAPRTNAWWVNPATGDILEWIED